MAGDQLTRDPVDVHVRALAAALHGPGRTRRSLLAEVRDGLRDAADAHEHTGLDPATAAHRAVAEFGAVADLAPHYQAELAAAQGRRTAVLLAAAFPGLVVGWDLLWSHGVAWAGPAPAGVVVLAVAQDVVSVVVGVAAVVALVALRAPDPRRAVTALGTLGVLAPAATAVLAVAMSLLTAPGPDRPVGGGPMMVAGYVASAAVLLLVARSVWRTRRVLARSPAR